MLARYSRPEMAAIWAPENRYRIWFEIEALAAEAMADLGTVPPELGAGHPRAGRRAARRHRPRGPGAHRRDRARDPPRRHRLPDLARRGGGAGQPVRPSRPDQQRRAGHHALGAAHPGHGPAAGRSGPRAGRAEGPRVRAQAHAHHRPQPRHPCRAHQFRPEARGALGRVRAATAPGSRPPARRSRSPHSPARWAPSPISTRRWRRMSPRGWGSRSSRSRPRSSRATATPPISRRWA